MTDRPKIEWSDEELEKAWDDTLGAVCGSEFVRRVLNHIKAVHPHECREREREAVWSGWLADQCETHNELREWMNVQYPSLLPPTPPALTLSTGEWTHNQISETWTKRGCGLVEWSPRVHTASDARALAEWLEKWGSEEERK